MNPENLQHLSQIALVIGAIITALGGYGTFYYGNKIKVEAPKHTHEITNNVIEIKGDYVQVNKHIQEATNINSSIDLENIAVIPDEILKDYALLKFEVINEGQTPININAVIFTAYHTKTKELVQNSLKEGFINSIRHHKAARYIFEITDLIGDRNLEKVMGDNPFRILLFFVKVFYTPASSDNENPIQETFHYRYSGGYGDDVVEPLGDFAKNIFDINSPEMKKSHAELLEIVLNNKNK